jgi:hypothetical protein
MPRRRKFNTKRHPSGQINYYKKDKGNEFALLRRAERFGEKNARDPLAADTDIIGNLLLAKKITVEQHEALTKASEIYRSVRTLRSVLWTKVTLDLPDAQVSTAPRLTPKTSSFGQVGMTLNDIDYEACENRIGSLNRTIAYMERNLDRVMIALVAYNEAPDLGSQDQREKFFDGVSWLVGHFQKAPRRRTVPHH